MINKVTRTALQFKKETSNTQNKGVISVEILAVPNQKNVDAIMEFEDAVAKASERLAKKLVD